MCPRCSHRKQTKNIMRMDTEMRKKKKNTLTIRCLDISSYDKCSRICSNIQSGKSSSSMMSSSEFQGLLRRTFDFHKNLAKNYGFNESIARVCVAAKIISCFIFICFFFFFFDVVVVAIDSWWRSPFRKHRLRTTSCESRLTARVCWLAESLLRTCDAISRGRCSFHADWNNIFERFHVHIFFMVELMNELFPPPTLLLHSTPWLAISVQPKSCGAQRIRWVCVWTNLLWSNI